MKFDKLSSLLEENSSSVRRLKVEDNRDSRMRPQGSKIRLKGIWLENAGFSPNDIVEVQYLGDGDIRITNTSK